ncbi:MAG TPA: hypothetical protein GX514_00295 [Thermoanaerobacterales bacterium]|nr:hypothetical protein [Thermoanaerobacterales bacterium]
MSLTIGIAGTAKNTGKTTTTSAILGELYNRNISIGLTSIGYDGEEIDNITGLPKPRLYVKENTILAIAKKCLKGGSAEYEVLETTNITTPLGNINIVRVVKEGLAVVAGPNKGSQLKYVKDKMINELGCKIILVDGALNRIAPMVETDGIIIATGAARNTNIDVLVEETKALYELLNLPKVQEDKLQHFLHLEKIALFPKNTDEGIKLLRYGSLIDNSTVNEILTDINNVQIIFIPYLISELALKQLNDNLRGLWLDKTLIIKDPIKLITGGDSQNLLNEIKRIKENGGNVETLKNLPLLAITVNPFYPKYRFDKNSYEPGYINRDELLEKMQNAMHIPVIDIKQEGAATLVNTLLIKLK